MNIFVYGTLRKNHGNHFLLRDSKFIGMAITEPSYTLACNGIPYLIKGGDSVTGEIYEVTPDVLLDLDMLEGNPDVYTRKPIKVFIDGEAVEAEAYHWTHDDNKRTLPTYKDYCQYTGRY